MGINTINKGKNKIGLKGLIKLSENNWPNLTNIYLSKTHYIKNKMSIVLFQ